MTILLFHFVFCVLPFWRGELDTHKSRKMRTRCWFSYLYHSILLILYSILLIWLQPFQSILLSRHLSTLFFSFGSHPANSAFPAVFTMCLLLGKQNCIIPKLNSDWLIPIKVHPNFKKNWMRLYSIKVLQSFWSKFALTVVTGKNPSKTLTKQTWSKQILIVTTRL